MERFTSRVPANYSRGRMRLINDKGKERARPTTESNIDGMSWATVSEDTDQLRRQGSNGPVNFGAPTASFFRYESMAVPDPSLLRPTLLIEEENNILIVQDIDKQYQLAVKDFNIQVRDNRIRAKDRQIAELDAELELKDSMLSTASMEKRKLADHVTRQDSAIEHVSDALKEMQSNLDEVIDTLSNKEAEVDQQDQELRLLRNDLEAAKAEIVTLKDRRLVDQILRYIRSVLGSRVRTLQSPVSWFPLFKLPGEIRNIIYTKCLVASRPIDFWPIRAPDATNKVRCPPWKCTYEIEQINPALLRASRQVHNETVGILYGCNHFRFSAQGGWTVLLGFLRHINDNCRNMTHISVCYPDWCSRDVVHRISAVGPSEETAMKAILKSWGNQILDCPIGPSSVSASAYRAAGEILLNLPALRQISIVVPHSVYLYSFGTDIMAQALTPVDKYLNTEEEDESDNKPTRCFILIRRPPTQSQFYNWQDVDDDVAMGRARLATLCAREDVEIKNASYGTAGELISYKVDGGEEEYDVEVPEDLVMRGDGYMLLRPFLAAKKLLGY